jgi:hypothetical protein
MPLDVDLHDGQGSRREQLLAVRHVRRDLECRAPQDVSGGKKPVAVNDSALARELRELIAALDRRAPRVAEAGEISIARDAAALRERALERLAELECSTARYTRST